MKSWKNDNRNIFLHYRLEVEGISQSLIILCKNYRSLSPFQSVSLKHRSKSSKIKTLDSASSDWEMQDFKIPTEWLWNTTNYWYPRLSVLWHGFERLRQPSHWLNWTALTKASFSWLSLAFFCEGFKKQ